MRWRLLINLLERKNLCFRSFNKLCLDFLDEIARGETAQLDEFQRKRDSLIKVLEQLEFEVNHCLKDIGSRIRPALETKQRIERILAEKEGHVKSILDSICRSWSHRPNQGRHDSRNCSPCRAAKTHMSAYRSPMDSVEAADGSKQSWTESVGWKIRL